MALILAAVALLAGTASAWHDSVGRNVCPATFEEAVTNFPTWRQVSTAMRWQYGSGFQDPLNIMIEGFKAAQQEDVKAYNTYANMVLSDAEIGYLLYGSTCGYMGDLRALECTMPSLLSHLATFKAKYGGFLPPMSDEEAKLLLVRWECSVAATLGDMFTYYKVSGSDPVVPLGPAWFVYDPLYGAPTLSSIALNLVVIILEFPYKVFRICALGDKGGGPFPEYDEPEAFDRSSGVCFPMGPGEPISPFVYGGCCMNIQMAVEDVFMIAPNMPVCPVGCSNGCTFGGGLIISESTRTVYDLPCVDGVIMELNDGMLAVNPDSYFVQQCGRAEIGSFLSLPSSVGSTSAASVGMELDGMEFDEEFEEDSDEGRPQWSTVMPVMHAAMQADAGPVLGSSASVFDVITVVTSLTQDRFVITGEDLISNSLTMPENAAEEDMLPGATFTIFSPDGSGPAVIKF
jgi:hypothetical protein